MAATNDNGNGKVSSAILSTKLDVLAAKLDKIETLLSTVVPAVAVLDTKVKSNADDIEDLESRVNTWSLLNSLGAGVALILGVFYSPRT